ncbi:MAG: MgtC/SapB family protein [bacterium]
MDFALTGTLLERFIAALLIGALVGLEREFAGSEDREKHLFAGIRTFPMISLLGFASALTAEHVPWIFPAALLSMGGLSAAAYIQLMKRGAGGGMTTEVSALLVFLLGALCFWNELSIAAAAAVIVTLLLSYKPALHRFVAVIEEEDVQAVLKFALITIVILPILPNQDMGPGGIFNPRLVWLMVVFISGVSFAGYGLTKVLGDRLGLLTTGVLGGFASSTAVTFSFTHQARDVPERAPGYATAVALATSTLYPRILLILLVWSPSLLPMVTIPFLILFLAGLAGSVWLWRSPLEGGHPGVDLSNPFELGPAFKFGAVFALILVLSRGSYEVMGTGGVYVTSFLAGLEGLDAITLSLGRMLTGELALEAAARGLLLAVVANTLVKAGIIGYGRTPEMIRRLLPFFAVQAVLAMTFFLLS